jgi:hypothetical protein
MATVEISFSSFVKLDKMDQETVVSILTWCELTLRPEEFIYDPQTKKLTFYSDDAIHSWQLSGGQQLTKNILKFDIDIGVSGSSI